MPDLKAWPTRRVALSPSTRRLAIGSLRAIEIFVAGGVHT